MSFVARLAQRAHCDPRVSLAFASQLTSLPPPLVVERFLSSFVLVISVVLSCVLSPVSRALRVPRVVFDCGVSVGVGARSARLSVPPSFLPFGADLIQACNQAYIISSYTVVRIQSTLLDSLNDEIKVHEVSFPEVTPDT